MEFDKSVKEQLLSRGYTEEQLLSNRGLIDSTINETVLLFVEKVPIQRADIVRQICPTDRKKPNFFSTFFGKFKRTKNGK